MAKFDTAGIFVDPAVKEVINKMPKTPSRDETDLRTDLDDAMAIVRELWSVIDEELAPDSVDYLLNQRLAMRYRQLIAKYPVWSDS